LYRLLDRRSGAEWFGRSLDAVPDADIWRWRACLVAAQRILKHARTDDDDE
jgi:hypothetical protein